MLTFKTILFPVDFSERASGAARYVKALANKFDSRVILLHVLETRIGQPGDPQFGGILLDPGIDLGERAKELLNAFLTEELTGPKIERWVVRGTPVSAILATIESEKADLVVIPTHGYSGIRRLLFGSTAAAILQRSLCPVLTGAHLDEAAHHPERALEIRRVLCPLDLTAASRSVLEAGHDLATQFGAELTLLHVVPGTEAVPDRQMDSELRVYLMSQAREQLQTLADSAGVHATISVEAGEVDRIIERFAQEREIDLVVIGRNHGRDHLFWQQLSYQIARKSPCPVVSI